MIPEDFYYKTNTLSLAKTLLGCELVHESPEGVTAGIIVETEAYLWDDPACHAFRGQTRRNATMFGPAGYLYVYIIYGLYHCINIVSGDEGKGEAVLIRALQPTAGISLMEKRRKLHPRTLEQLPKPVKLTSRNLCNGPGKLAQAMGFRMEHDGLSLTESGNVYLKNIPTERLPPVITTRIGITLGAEMPYRFLMPDNPYVSVKPKIIFA